MHGVIRVIQKKKCGAILHFKGCFEHEIRIVPKFCIVDVISPKRLSLKAGPSQGLKIRGVRSNVVGIICPLVEIGLTVWPKTVVPLCLIVLIVSDQKSSINNLGSG